MPFRKKKPVVKKVKKSSQTFDQFLKDLTGKFGEGVVWQLGQKPVDHKVGVVKTKSILLNWLIGIGGFPRGRITEISGPESAGKTTICYHVISCEQKAGGVCAFLDIENSFEPAYAAKCGVNIEDLIIVQPDYGEQALEIMESLVQSEKISVIVLDSVAALSPKAEVEGDIGDARVGLLPKMMSQALRRLNIMLKDSNVCVILTNQIRDKIGGFSGWGGPQTDTPGGHALKHFASVRMGVWPGEKMKIGEDPVGFYSSIRINKNKVAPPFRKALVPILYGKGIVPALELVRLGQAAKVIKKKGAFYYVGKYSLGRGWNTAAQVIAKNATVRRIVAKAVKRHLDEQSKLTE